MITNIKKTVVAGALMLAATSAFAADKMLPFTLGYTTTGDVKTIAADVEAKLAAANFTIAGSYAPYDGAHIIAITNDTLKNVASQSDDGGYGAAQRVTITNVDGEVQVSYTNPEYAGAAYRLGNEAKLSVVAKTLSNVLGSKEQYGPADGKTAEELAEYHYMFGMEYFDEPSDLAEYDSYDEAVAAVEEGLANGAGGATKVYRIDIPGKNQTVFGVALAEANDENCHSDKFIMSEIDFKPIRSTGHLPYEILVSDGEVNALFARFRIAINFPDLAMMGPHSFMNIMCAPGAIEEALTEAAGGEI